MPRCARRMELWDQKKLSDWFFEHPWTVLQVDNIQSRLTFKNLRIFFLLSGIIEAKAPFSWTLSKTPETSWNYEFLAVRYKQTIWEVVWVWLRVCCRHSGAVKFLLHSLKMSNGNVKRTKPSWKFFVLHLANQNALHVASRLQVPLHSTKAYSPESARLW